MFWVGLTCQQSTLGKELCQQHLGKTRNRTEILGQIHGREAQQQQKRGFGWGGGGGGGCYLTFLLLGTACVLAAFLLNLTSFPEKIFMSRFAPPPLYWLLCVVQVY